MKKIPVAVLGATGYVGQQFVVLLARHPWFTIVDVAASPRSAGKRYEDAVRNKWYMRVKVPTHVRRLRVKSVQADAQAIAGRVQLVFCALDLDKKSIQKIEETYASLGVGVISNNSANREERDIPMIIPEINPHHLSIIPFQRKRRGWTKGFIVVKPNCSIQSYVSVLAGLKRFHPTHVRVVSLQAISGAGKTFKTWPEMIDNIVPFISGEEDKSEREPLKIWGKIHGGYIHSALNPKIEATCVRVPVSEGHLAVVTATFKYPMTREQFIHEVKKFSDKVYGDLPSSPDQYITIYKDDLSGPQLRADRGIMKGMGISIGRVGGFGKTWRFVALAHNVIRGAAGGAILTAELLVKKGYIY